MNRLTDDRLGVRLSHVLSAFNAAINEEQCWALCHQICQRLRQLVQESAAVGQQPPQSLLLPLLSSAHYLLLHRDGHVTLTEELSMRAKTSDENEVIASLGVLLFQALDFGLPEDEERALSTPLEVLIETLTSADKSHNKTGQEQDEGIERDHCDHFNNSHNNSDVTFASIIEMCVSRLPSRETAESHYRNVCRALVLETLELSTFLDQIARGTKQLRQTASAAQDKLPNTIASDSGRAEDTRRPVPGPSADEVQFHQWARLWMDVIRELREGVKLKKVTSEESNNCEFELTPYEMLLHDIKLRRYALNPVMVNGHLPERPRKDAHALILDFIRSRPPLVPVAKRQLRPLPDKQSSLYDRLMHSIRQQHKLRPTPCPRSPALLPSTSSSRFTTDLMFITDKVSETSSQSADEWTPTPTRRRLIKADLTLRLSDEEEDNGLHLPKSEHQNLQSQEALNEDREEEKNRRKFSLKNLSLRLLSHERRHSITVCESPKSEDTTGGELEYKCNPNSNADARQHVASIWESTDWGHSLQGLSLTLQEVQHIRSVLTKAEIETLAVTKDLRTDLESGRICFTCLKTRFSFFSRNWPSVCKLCERAICDRCATKMHIPCEHFEKVPIYMLSPTPSPPDPPSDGKRAQEWPQRRAKDSQSSPQMEVSQQKRSRLVSKLLNMSRDSDIVVVDASNRKMGPLVRVCRDCKILVRHLIDTGRTNYARVVDTCE